MRWIHEEQFYKFIECSYALTTYVNFSCSSSNLATRTYVEWTDLRVLHRHFIRWQRNESVSTVIEKISKTAWKQTENIYLHCTDFAGSQLTVTTSDPEQNFTNTDDVLGDTQYEVELVRAGGSARGEWGAVIRGLEGEEMCGSRPFVLWWVSHTNCFICNLFSVGKYVALFAGRPSEGSRRASRQAPAALGEDLDQSLESGDRREEGGSFSHRLHLTSFSPASRRTRMRVRCWTERARRFRPTDRSGSLPPSWRKRTATRTCAPRSSTEVRVAARMWRYSLFDWSVGDICVLSQRWRSWKRTEWSWTASWKLREVWQRVDVSGDGVSGKPEQRGDLACRHQTRERKQWVRTRASSAGSRVLQRSHCSSTKHSITVHVYRSVFLLF